MNNTTKDTASNNAKTITVKDVIESIADFDEHELHLFSLYALAIEEKRELKKQLKEALGGAK